MLPVGNLAVTVGHPGLVVSSGGWFGARLLEGVGEAAITAAHVGSDDIRMQPERREQVFGGRQVLELDDGCRIEGNDLGHRAQFGQFGTAPVVDLAGGEEERGEQQADAERDGDNEGQAAADGQVAFHRLPPTTCRARRSICELAFSPARLMAS